MSARTDRLTAGGQDVLDRWPFWRANAGRFRLLDVWTPASGAASAPAPAVALVERGGGTALVGLGAAGAAALRQLGADTTAFSGTFRGDALSHWGVLILAPAAGLCCLLARQELRGTPREGTVYSLLCFGTLGAALLAGTGDLMFLVLGLLILAGRHNQWSVQRLWRRRHPAGSNP